MSDITMSDKLRRTQFLGREFLTWLLFRSFRDGGMVKLGDRTIEVYFERALTLDGENPAREMATIKVDDPTRSEEVMLSLKLGKKVSKAMITLIIDTHEFTTNIDSSTLALKSLKLPDAKGLDIYEIMEEKATFTDTVEDAIHQLFVQFVKMRINDAEWSREAEEIAGWIDTDGVLG